METRRSGKEMIRRTRASASPRLAPKLGLKTSPLKSPSLTGSLKRLKKLKRHKLEEKVKEKTDTNTSKLTSSKDEETEKRKSLPAMDIKSQGGKVGEGVNKSPGIRTRLSTGSIHMNGTMTISTAKEKAEQENILKQIEKEASRSPVSSKKRNSASGSSDSLLTDHPPPKKRKIGRNDGSGEDNRNDYYCWLCHKEGTVVCCELCPRVYHTKCLDLAGELPHDWVCPECEKIMRAECTDTRSKSMEMLTLDQLCTLLLYALERMAHAGSEPFQRPVDLNEIHSYSDYVFYPMDLETLEKNIKKKMYGSTEALLSDTKWILHNCIIFNGAHNKLTGSAKMIVKICKHEMNEIELCPDCYLNSCIRRNDEWFSELCRTPHTLVWAKLKGYPFWPAKALREEDGQVDVRFFGAHDRSWVPVSQCFLLSKNIPTSLQKGKKNSGLDGAIDELNKHVNKLRVKFGHFEYAPFRTPYDKTDSYKPVNFKPSSSPSSSNRNLSSNLTSPTKPFAPVTLPQRTKLSCKTAAAVKSKYSAIVSLKKVDYTPEKFTKHSLTSHANWEIVDKSKDTDDVSENISNKEVDNSGDNHVMETSTKDTSIVQSNVKKNFVSMSIVEKVEQKILGITETDNKETGDSFTTVSSEPSTVVHETESECVDKHAKAAEHVEGNKTVNDSLVVNDKSITTDKTVHLPETTSVPDSGVDGKEPDSAVSDIKDNASDRKDNHVISTEVNNSKDMHENTNKEMSSSEGETDTEKHMSIKEKKDTFKENLKLTIANCKEKVGLSNVIDEQLDEEPDEDEVDGEGETMDTNTEDENDRFSLHYSETEDSEMDESSSQVLEETETNNGGIKEGRTDQDIGKAQDESNEISKIVNSGVTDQENISCERIEVTDTQLGDCKDKTEDHHKENTKVVTNSTLNGATECNVKNVISDSDQTKPTETIMATMRKDELSDDLEPTEKITSCSVKEQHVSTSTGEENEGQPILSTNDNFDGNKEKMNVETTSESEIITEDRSVKDKNNVMPVMAQSVLDSQDVKDKVSSMEEGDTSVSHVKSDSDIFKNGNLGNKETNESSGKENNEAGCNTLQGLESNSACKQSKKMPIKFPSHENVLEISISEDDSDIERLVIDLDSEKESPVKFSVKGGEVKNGSNFKHGASPLVRTNSEVKSPNKSPAEITCDRKQSGLLEMGTEKVASKPPIAQTAVKNGSPEANVETDMRNVTKSSSRVNAKSPVKTSSSETSFKTSLKTSNRKTSGKTGIKIVVENSSSSEVAPAKTQAVRSKIEDDSVDKKTVPDTAESMDTDIIDLDRELTPVKKGPKKSSPVKEKPAGTKQDPVTDTDLDESPMIVDPVEYLTKKTPEELSEKFMKRILNSVQKTFGEMMDEIQQTQVASSKEPSNKVEQVKWNNLNEITELKHNYQLTFNEMQASWKSQKEQIVRAMSAKHEQELEAVRKQLNADMEKAVSEAKKKQWCAYCQKEAGYYCCWNTSYCNYPCQEAHWPQHSLTCMQTNKNTDNNETGESPAGSSQKQGTGSTLQQPYRHFPEALATAIRREEEKRGEVRPGLNQMLGPKFIQGPSTGMQNIHSTQIKLGTQSASPMPGGMFVNQGITTRPPQSMNNPMLLQQPILQQAVYPVQVQRQQSPFSNTIIFPPTNPPQPNVLGFNPGHQF